MKLRCLIVDDEPLALDILENYIQRLDNLELVARCENAIEAFNQIQSSKVDLLFLDIQMPKLTGIDFLKSVQNPPKVIFTTAYRDYALEGYELNVLDYLLKPISFERFLRSINKVLAQSNGQHLTPTETPNLTISSEQNESYVYVKADKKMVKIRLKEVIYIESLKDYVRIKMAEKEVVTYQKISYLEEKLPEELFLRIHRSFIIALDKVDSFSATLVEVNGQELPIGRNYKNQTLKVLGKNNLLD